MILRRQPNRFTLIALSMMFLALSNILPGFASVDAPDTVDGIRGVLAGLSIGLGILAIVVAARQRQSDGTVQR